MNRRHGSHMRAALPILLATASWGGDAFGIWKLNPGRSTLAASLKTISLRIEPHARGEVFTLETVARDGRVSTSSTILYLDGKARDFEDAACSGTQSSWRVDERTVEIARDCMGGGKIRLIRRSVNPAVLTLDVTELHPDGSRFEQRLVLEKH